MPRHINIPTAAIDDSEGPAFPATVLTEQQTREYLRSLTQKQKPSLAGKALGWIKRQTLDKLTDTLFGDSIRASDHVALEGIQDDLKYAVRKWEFAAEFQKLKSVTFMKELKGKILENLKRLPENVTLRRLQHVMTNYETVVGERIDSFWNDVLETKNQGAPEYIPYVKKLRNGSPMENTLNPYIIGKKRIVYGENSKRETIYLKSLSTLFEKDFLRAAKKLETESDPGLQDLALDLITAVVLHQPSVKTINNRNQKIGQPLVPAKKWKFISKKTPRTSQNRDTRTKGKPNRPVRGTAGRREPRAA